MFETSGRGPHYGRFFDDDERPELARCAVLFVDLLGITQLAQSDNALEYLRTLNTALTASRDFLAEDSEWPAAYFSDSLVVVSPVGDGTDGQAVADLSAQAARIQLDLLRGGYALRGGLAVGDIHLSRNLMFGPGLIEAYRLEAAAAIDPRIVLSDAAVSAVRDEAVGDLGGLASTLVEDQDGAVVVDYLTSGVVRGDLELSDGLTWHRELIEKRRAEHAKVIQVWSKWNWVGQYHNAVCERITRDEGVLRVDGVGERRFEEFSVVRG